jgi:hypothetical protein
MQMSKRHSEAYAFILGMFLISFCAMASPKDNEILSRLKKADLEVSEGDITYRVEERLTPPSMTDEQIEDVVEAERRRLRSQNLDRETLSQRLAETRLRLRSTSTPHHSVSTKTLIYTKDRHYKSQVTPEDSSPLAAITQGYDGKNNLMLNGRELSVSSQIPSEIEGGENRTLVPWACYPMGRGLSTLKDLNLIQGGDEPVVEGKRGETRFRAILDPKHGYIAKSIESRPDPGRTTFLYHYELAQPRRTKEGVWLPGWVKARMESGGSPYSETEYRLVHASFGEPEADALTIPLTGKRISDRRMGRPISYAQLPDGVTNLDDLGKVTKKEVEEQVRVMQTLEQSQEHQFRLKVLLGSLFLAALIGFGWTLQRTLKRRAT